MEDARFLEELSRINNELVNARRELSRLNAALDEKERFLSRVLELSPNLIYVHDLRTGRHVYRNRALDRALGITEPVSANEESLVAFLHPDDLAAYAAGLQGLEDLPDGGSISLEFRVQVRDRGWRWHLARESVFLRDGEGRPISAIGVAEDIDDYKARELALADASNHDQLTGLLNRRGFEEGAGRLLELATRRREALALAFFDLDRFKTINDLHGHAEGDEALKAMAAALSGGFRESDLVARLGGDEFVVLAGGADLRILEILVGRLRGRIAAWNAASGKPWLLEFSAGLAVGNPEDTPSLENLLCLADEAMYAEKQLRKSSC